MSLIDCSTKNELTLSLFNSIYQVDAGGNLALRLFQVTGTGNSYYLNNKKATDDQVMRGLIGVNGSGDPSLRVIAVADSSTNAVDCSTPNNVFEDFQRGIIEEATDGFPALRIVLT